MCKKYLRGVQKMSAESFVADARKWAERLVMNEYRGPGQMDRAMDRVSQKTGIDRNVLWGLRYRPPKDILASVYFQLKTAYEAEVHRQDRLYRHERAVAHALNPKIVGAADAVAGEKSEP